MQGTTFAGQAAECEPVLDTKQIAFSTQEDLYTLGGQILRMEDELDATGSADRGAYAAGLPADHFPQGATAHPGECQRGGDLLLRMNAVELRKGVLNIWGKGELLCSYPFPLGVHNHLSSLRYGLLQRRGTQRRGEQLVDPTSWLLRYRLGATSSKRRSSVLRSSASPFSPQRVRRARRGGAVVSARVVDYGGAAQGAERKQRSRAQLAGRVLGTTQAARHQYHHQPGLTGALHLYGLV